MLNPETPALVLAPMDGITDAPMRALMAESGTFTYAVSEFLRVSTDPIPPKVFRREVPELAEPTGLPVQIQILGGDPERMAISAMNAVKAGAPGVDINFGCPAPTVNRNDGGATLLKTPCRIRDVVAAIRQAVPPEIPVSAKLRLGWDDIESIHENAAMAAEGGASWLTIHARTRVQGYTPPVYWPSIGKVRERLALPVVANGDIWTFDDFQRCRDETGCHHFMIGRGALANPPLPWQIAQALGIGQGPGFLIRNPYDWVALLKRLVATTERYEGQIVARSVARLKQWLNLAHRHGDFPYFDLVKRTTTVDDFFASLTEAIEATKEPLTAAQACRP